MKRPHAAYAPGAGNVRDESVIEKALLRSERQLIHFIHHKIMAEVISRPPIIAAQATVVLNVIVTSAIWIAEV